MGCSRVCTFSDFQQLWFRDMLVALNMNIALHRKTWEVVCIAHELHSRGMLEPDMRGLVFGVGNELLPGAFAEGGCRILATDAPADSVGGEWKDTGQHCTGVDRLNRKCVKREDQFRRLVEYRDVDMRHIPQDLDGQFDFCWSCCAFEHLGSLDAGLEFVVGSMRTLRPGGWAVHTTEYNCTSNDLTVADGGCVFYRQCDILRLGQMLEAAGCRMEPFDPRTGNHPVDELPDMAPYAGHLHLKLKHDTTGYVVTSVAVIAQRLG